MKSGMKALDKTRQHQTLELKRLANRFVMQARHANQLTQLASGGQEEEYAQRHFDFSLKHSEYAALAALGVHQLCRYKVFSAFQNKIDVEKKTFKVAMHKLQ